MGKTKYLFKKIRDTKRTFHAKIGSIKDRNGPNRSRDIKKRCKNTQNCTKKILMTQITTMVQSHSEPDILECEVKQALGSTAVKKLEVVMEFQKSYLES